VAPPVGHQPDRWLAIVVIVVCAAWPAGCSRGAPSPSTPPVTPARAATGTATPAATGSSAATVGAGPSVPGAQTLAAASAQPSELTPPANLDLSRLPGIPLSEGLIVVTSVAEERGDYEVVKRISGPAADRIHISYSATVPVAGQPTELHGQRIVLTRDLQSARIYRVRWLSGRTELARGTTALGISTEVFEEVRRDGRSECSLASIEEAGSLLGATGLPSPEFEGELERVEQRPVPVPVILDGERAWLPAIHARGTFEGLTGEVDAEFWFLDDPRNPLTLRAVIGTARLVVVRIDRPKSTDSTRLERALASDEQVELPGVYFEFASARLRPESEAAIAEVVGVLRRHPDWRVRLEGHTDSIGGADANLGLSRARAGAVRQAVIDRFGGGADRLEAAGFGLTRPRERNDTAEGRASNRRVEIVRVR